jgi:hypothetical protein
MHYVLHMHCVLLVYCISHFRCVFHVRFSFACIFAFCMCDTCVLSLFEKNSGLTYAMSLKHFTCFSKC